MTAISGPKNDIFAFIVIKKTEKEHNKEKVRAKGQDHLEKRHLLSKAQREYKKNLSTRQHNLINMYYTVEGSIGWTADSKWVIQIAIKNKNPERQNRDIFWLDASLWKTFFRFPIACNFA